MSEPDAPQLPKIPDAPFGFRAGGPSRILSLAERQAQIDADIERIRRHSLGEPQRGRTADGPDGLAIQHSVLFMAAIDRQMRAMSLGLQVGQEVYDLERVRTYMAGISDLVGRRIAQMDPAVHETLMADLKALNEAFLVGGGDDAQA